MADMQELIARLEAAEAGCRELDAEIWASLRPEKIKITGIAQPYGDNSGATQVLFTLPPKRTELATQKRGDFQHADPVTTSLDAAIALAERVLPGCGWSVSMDDRMGWYQSDIGKDHYLFAGEPSRSLARTPALALCIAILKAIQHARSSTAGYEAAGEVSPNLKAKAQGEGG